VRVSGKRTLGWALVAALWIVATWFAPAAPRTTGRAPLLEWLGPFAELGSNLQWIRFQRARLAGDQERAFLHAENALALRPTATEGWQLLAAHLGYFLASPAREPDPDTRLAWFRAGLEVTRRGETVAEHPEALMLMRGILLLNKAELDPEIWPGGAAGLLAEAEAAFRAARDAGEPDAEDFLGYVLSFSDERGAPAVEGDLTTGVREAELAPCTPSPTGELGGITPQVDVETGKGDYGLVYWISDDGRSITTRFIGPSEAVGAPLRMSYETDGDWHLLVCQVVGSDYQVPLAKWQIAKSGQLENCHIRTDPFIEWRALGIKPGQLVTDVEWRPLVSGVGVGAWRN